MAQSAPSRSSIEKSLSSGRRFLAAFAQFSGGRGAAALALVAAGAVLEGLGLVLLAPILTVVAPVAGSMGRYQAALDSVFGSVGASSPAQKLILLLAVFVGVMLLRAWVLFMRDTRLAALQAGFIEHQRLGVISRLSQAGWARVAGLRHARVINLLSSDITRIGQAAHFMVQVSVALALVVIQGAVALALSPALTLAAAGILGLSLLVLLPLSSGARDLGARLGEANLALTGSTTGFLAGLKAAQAQNAERGFVAEFETLQSRVTVRQLAFVARQSAGRNAFAAVSALAGALVVLAGFHWLQAPPVLLVTLVLIFTRMSGPVMLIQQGLQQIVYSLPAFEAVQALNAELASARDAARDGPALPPPPGPVRFEGAGYRHGDEGGGLAPLDLEISPGTFLGVVGPSGAGKTTFADLLVGLLSPQAGQITVGGAVLEGPVLAGWRSQVAYVAQDPFLFHDSIRRNLSWARPDADEAAMWAALETCGAGPLVRRLGGLEAVVGERGSLLSGGERQRIALARALLSRPRLLLLDEATNAIDVAGEAALLQTMAALSPRPTIVMIAHRSESLSLCDRMLVLTADGSARESAAAAASKPRPAGAATDRAE